MPEKNLENITMLTYIGVFSLSMFGGFVSYLRKLRHGKPWRITDFLIEITTAAFSGIVAYFICLSMGMDDALAAAITGISGHYSTQTITIFGKILDKVLGNFGEKK